MSLLDNATKANLTTAYWAAAGSGGGGGSVSSFTTAFISSLSVSSIVGVAGAAVTMPAQLQVSSIGGALGPLGLTVFDNGIDMQPNALLRFEGAGEIQFTDSFGRLNGVSTINGNPFVAPPPPQSLPGPYSDIIAPGGSATLVSFSTTAGHAYTLGGLGNLRVFSAGTINPEDTTEISIIDGVSVGVGGLKGQVALMSTLSTTAGIAGSLATSWVATAANASLLAINNNPAGSVSTLNIASGLVVIDQGAV